MKNRVIIAGSRSCPENDDDLFLKLTLLFRNTDYNDLEIVSGRCKGADKLGENYANEMKVPVKQFPADWSLGKKAGYIRNKQMAEYATHLIAIWDGKSKGTKLMIDLAKENGLHIRVIKIGYKPII